MANELHIVSFDAPAPADYGGAIDVHCKVQALAETGAAVTLHYFGYKPDRGHAGLDPFCKNIFRYARKPFRQCLHSRLPFIVASRINAELIKQLNADRFPVLLEGIHCTGIIPYLRKDRTIAIRLHNNEADYYRRLAHAEHRPWHNLYYTIEANRLDRYQKTLPFHLPCFALSTTDEAFFQQQYGWHATQFVPAFVPWMPLPPQREHRSYCLYHGNLSVSENNKVVIWLLQHVFTDGKVPFVVAGKDPSPALIRHVNRRPNVRLVANPDEGELNHLLAGAQVHLLPSLNATGVKLKLLHALFSGGHCLVNTAAVSGSGLEAGVHIADDAAAMQTAVQQLMVQPFTAKDMTDRMALLEMYQNRKNAATILNVLENDTR